MTRLDIKREKKDFVVFIVMGIFMHIAGICAIVSQFIPEATITGILKAIFFGALIIAVMVAYWISMARYAKAIKNAEKKLEDK